MNKLLMLIAIFALAMVVGCGGMNPNLDLEVAKPVIPNERLSIVDGPLQVGRYRHYVWIIKDSETEKEFILVTETDGTSICPVPQ